MNRSRTRAAAELVGGDYAIFQVLGPDVLEVGDVMTGALNTLGIMTLRNETKNREVSVLVEIVPASPGDARQLLGGS